MSKFPFIKQYDQMDCGPTCLRMITKHYGKNLSGEYIREITSLSRGGTTLGGLADAAEAIGMSSLALNIDFETLKNDLPLPCIAHWRQRHYVVVYGFKKDKVQIADPAFGLIDYTEIEFKKGWLPQKNTQENAEGVVLLLETTPLFFEIDDTTKENKNSFGFLFRYFRGYKKYFLQLFLGLLVGSLLQLIMPFLTQAVVDNGINTRNLNFVYLVLIAQLVLFASQMGVNVIRSWIILHITNRINLRMLSDFLIKLMRLNISFFEAKNIGDILQRIQDHNRIQNFLSASTLDVLFSGVNLVIFSSILCYFNFSIFLVFLVGTLLYVVWIQLFMKKRAKLDYQYFDQASGNQSSSIQLINGMQEIKLNGSERRRRWEWEAIQARLFKLSIQSLSLNQTQNVGGNFINEIKNILISFLAAKSVIDGQISLGTMLSVQYIIGQMNVPINNFITFVRGFQDAQLSLNRLAEIHHKPDEESPEAHLVHELPEDKGIHIVQNLSFKYGSSSSENVLQNINLKIPAGKITAIVGASGSGKTTLLKLLLKFSEPNTGKIQIGNSPLANLSYNFWRSQCGVVMQDGYIFSDSIARNISESDPDGIVDKQKLREAIRIANIGDFIESLPMGLNTRIGSSGMGISGGQKQRILIARAVYKNPAFLFFDEATSALDANNEAVIMKNLNDFFVNKTVVVVAHRLSTVKNADQIIVLNKGEIVETGNHESLVAGKGYYFNLVKNQLDLGE
ncbi:MAG: peptidase domain-containing ABC transporter [Pseudarcicella sp.]|nr:peptidase domain-containing ABC transporter [Pseudarcicella sp.]